MRVEPDFFGTVPDNNGQQSFNTVSGYFESKIGIEAFKQWFKTEANTRIGGYSSSSSSSFHKDASTAGGGSVKNDTDLAFDVVRFAHILTTLVNIQECDALWIAEAFGIGDAGSPTTLDQDTTLMLFQLLASLAPPLPQKTESSSRKASPTQPKNSSSYQVKNMQQQPINDGGKNVQQHFATHAKWYFQRLSREREHLFCWRKTDVRVAAASPHPAGRGDQSSESNNQSNHQAPGSGRKNSKPSDHDDNTEGETAPEYALEAISGAERVVRWSKFAQFLTILGVHNADERKATIHAEERRVCMYDTAGLFLPEDCFTRVLVNETAGLGGLVEESSGGEESDRNGSSSAYSHQSFSHRNTRMCVIL